MNRTGIDDTWSVAAPRGTPPPGSARQPGRTNGMQGKITIHVGDEARSLLRDAAFVEAWQHLLRSCHWATPFQSPAFVNTWFTHYAADYSPVLLAQRAVDGALLGLLPLARSRRESRLVIAGTDHAEYQSWLAHPDSGDAFIARALCALDDVCAGQALLFKYLPPKTPTRGLRTHPLLGRRCRFETHRRPLMTIEPTALSASLKKKGNRSRINRLRRLGEVELDKIDDPTSFAEVFDEIIRHYDFRQGAKHGSPPFRGDPHKKPFHLALMQQPGLLHATVLRVGGAVAAAHVGARGNGVVHLGIFSHAPSLAQQSPGKVHLLLLAMALADEGVAVFDLTPGGDLYKERFANAHDHVERLTIFPSRWELAREQARDRCVRSIKRAARSFGITPPAVRGTLARAKQLTVRGLARRAMGALANADEMLVYRHPAGALVPAGGARRLAVDNLDDLLCFEPRGGAEGRQAFLAAALARLERGEHVYTYVEGGHLLQQGWVIDGFGNWPPAGERQSTVAATSLLYDLRTHPRANGRGLYRQCLDEMLRDAAAAEAALIYALARADDTAARRIVETAGFRRVCRLPSAELPIPGRPWVERQAPAGADAPRRRAANGPAR